MNQPTQRLARIVEAPWFHRCVTVVVLLAGVLAGLETSASFRERYGALFYALDSAVLAFFLAEMGLRFAVHGSRPWGFFRDPWNGFDLAIVLLCCLPMDSQFAAVLRLARGLRLLRLITALPKLQLLVGALLKSLRDMGYVGLLLGLMFYIYGVAGVHLFGLKSPEIFGTLAASMLTLFRLITLDNWSDLYAAVEATAPVAAPVFFISFILLGTMIMLNLFIGIIMNSMSEMHAEIEQQDLRRNAMFGSPPGQDDELRALEAELESFRRRIGRLRTTLEARSS